MTASALTGSIQSNDTMKGITMDLFGWTKKRKPQRKMSPTDRARLYASERDADLLACLIDTDGAFIALVAEGSPSTKTFDAEAVPEQTSRVQVVAFLDGQQPQPRMQFERSIDAMETFINHLPPAEHDGFRAAMMFADCRWLMGALPMINDALDILPLINPDKLDGARWVDADKRCQLLTLAIVLGPNAYAKIAHHERLNGLTPYLPGLHALTGMRQEDAAE